MAGLGLVAVAACSGGGGQGASGDPIGTTTSSSPFTVGHEPEGFRLVQAGRGNWSQEWGSESIDDQPITVLAPRGADPDGPEAVRVTTRGFDEELYWAEGGAPEDDVDDGPVDLSGRPARYDFPRDGTAGPASVVVQAEEDVVLEVTSSRSTRDEILAVARQVELEEDHLLAPRVPDPPGDLEVVGSADADVAITLTAEPQPSGSPLPAGDRSHTAVWARGEPGTPWTPADGTVAVSTLPGQALDLDVIAASLHGQEHLGQPEIVPRTVEGRAAVVLDHPDNGKISGGPRAVLTTTPAGDLLMVVAQGADLPSAGELVAVAASVEPATEEEWEGLVDRARG